MRLGINYDTGVFPGGRQSRPVFKPEQAAFDMEVIARDLRCPAVRVSGGDLERLTIAAGYAADAGLDVWFSPFPCEMDAGEMKAFHEDAADRAEALRQRSANKVVFMAGCEVSVFGRGFLPGADAYARLSQLSAPSPEMFAEYPKTVARLNGFLAETAAAVRARFGGPVTYASGLWEQIDWTPFDIVGVDAYRDRSNAGTLDGQLAALAAQGKPVVVTEFGCCTYRGAADKGAAGWMIPEDCVRDECEQVRYLREMIPIYERQNIGTAFWFTFASWNRPYHQDAREDLDLASFGVVKVVDIETSVPRDCWRPKTIAGVFNCPDRGAG